MLSSFVHHRPRLELGEHPRIRFGIPYEDHNRVAEALDVVLGPPDATWWGTERMWRRGGTVICYAEHSTRTVMEVELVVAPDCWKR